MGNLYALCTKGFHVAACPEHNLIIRTNLFSFVVFMVFLSSQSPPRTPNDQIPPRELHAALQNPEYLVARHLPAAAGREEAGVGRGAQHRLVRYSHFAPACGQSCLADERFEGVDAQCGRLARCRSPHAPNGLGHARQLLRAVIKQMAVERRMYYGQAAAVVAVGVCAPRHALSCGTGSRSACRASTFRSRPSPMPTSVRRGQSRCRGRLSARAGF